MKEQPSKFKSRKFILTVLAVVMSLVFTNGVAESEVSEIVGVIMTYVTILSYIFVEGKIDSKRAQSLLKVVTEKAKEIEKEMGDK